MTYAQYIHLVKCNSVAWVEKNHGITLMGMTEEIGNELVTLENELDESVSLKEYEALEEEIDTLETQIEDCDKEIDRLNEIIDELKGE